MSNREEDENGSVESEQKSRDNSKKNWETDLDKVNELNKETDNGKEVSNVKLDSLISNPNGQQQGTTKAVSIRKEDTQLLMEELELPKTRIEKKLIEHGGDVFAAAKDLLGF